MKQILKQLQNQVLSSVRRKQHLPPKRKYLLEE